jgi:ribosomal protein L11 methylase PrmA
MSADEVQPASYRDPSGFLFRREGVLYRHVAPSYAAEYDRLTGSGLYRELVDDGLLVAHEEVAIEGHGDAHRVLRPTAVELVSYPYEWAFSALRDAALLTLELAERALARGLALKDASAFNVQFRGCLPVFIDTLSFEAYREGEPWVAYRQFCEHFLAPLALMSRLDARMLGLWRAHLEGVPLDLASRLLPFWTWLRFGLLTHLHLHARSQALYADRPPPRRRVPVGRTALVALLDSLRRTVRSLAPRPAPSEWADYERTHAYSDETQRVKEATVTRWLEGLRPRQVWDLGANVGRFGRIAASCGAYAVCFDADPAVVELAYRAFHAEGRRDLIPLVLDLANPSPGLGWEGRERDSLETRGPADTLLALALVHHLAIGRNVPLPHLARWMARLSPVAIVEFVPKEDPQAQRLLRSRRDVFPDYASGAFEDAFARSFRLEAREVLPSSGRVLYLWRANG